MSSLTLLNPRLVINDAVSVGCPSSREGWKSFQFHIMKFHTLPTTKVIFLLRRFSWNGCQWGYPGGHHGAAEGFTLLPRENC